jgi:RNA polymerase primary sigma factor
MMLSVEMPHRKPAPIQTHKIMENKEMPHPDPREIEQTFAMLGMSEQMVLKLRSGMIDGHRHTLREVGTFLGTTRAAVRTLEWQSWQKLQAHAQSNQVASGSVQYILDRCRIRKPRNSN